MNTESKMSDVLGVAAITSATSLLTVVVSRVRCIIRPCSDGEKCQSGCSDQPLEKRDEPHEIDIQACEWGERKCFVLSSRE